MWLAHAVKFKPECMSSSRNNNKKNKNKKLTSPEGTLRGAHNDK
jgi:hypothetical protein